MEVKKGSTISVSYVGTFDDGSVFDSSQHGDHEHALEFTVGNNEVISGFEKAVLGMHEGEEKTFALEPAEAYGERRDDLRQKIPRNALPPAPEPTEGMILMMRTPQGHEMPLRIVSVSKDSVSVDVNHPLAGKRLHFKIKILKIS